MADWNEDQAPVLEGTAQPPTNWSPICRTLARDMLAGNLAGIQGTCEELRRRMPEHMGRHMTAPAALTYYSARAVLLVVCGGQRQLAADQVRAASTRYWGILCAAERFSYEAAVYMCNLALLECAVRASPRALFHVVLKFAGFMGEAEREELHAILQASAHSNSTA